MPDLFMNQGDFYFGQHRETRLMLVGKTGNDYTYRFATIPGDNVGCGWQNRMYDPRYAIFSSRRVPR